MTEPSPPKFSSVGVVTKFASSRHLSAWIMYSATVRMDTPRDDFGPVQKLDSISDRSVASPELFREFQIRQVFDRIRERAYETPLICGIESGNDLKCP